MQLVIQHYNTRKQEGHFPDSTTSIVLAAVYGGAVALPNQLNTVRGVLTTMGLPIILRQYSVREQGNSRARGETSMIVHGRAGIVPSIYVNDKPLA